MPFLHTYPMPFLSIILSKKTTVSFKGIVCKFEPTEDSAAEKLTHKVASLHKNYVQ